MEMKNSDASGLNLRKVKRGKGLLCIADISGFTNFVRQTELNVGLKMTKILLQAIIESNQLNLNVSEIEGDAVLFYRYGKPPKREQILFQFEEMLKVFHKKLERTNKKRKLPFELSLKLIVHYGEISQYTIGNFTKLYGQSVIEVHRLLKTSIKHSQYALLTDDYLKESFPMLGQNVNRHCEILEYLRKLCCTYFPYEMQSKEEK